jgi:hypothetical protein
VLEVNVTLQNVLPASALFPRVEVARIHVLSAVYLHPSKSYLCLKDECKVDCGHKEANPDA